MDEQTSRINCRTIARCRRNTSPPCDLCVDYFHCRWNFGGGDPECFASAQCTVWSLVERQTYVIDDIIQQPGWDTIDKVRYHDHFYSTKPALLPTLVAGVYYCVKRTTGWNLTNQTTEVTRLVLLIVNLLPMIAALIVFAAFLERYAQRDRTRVFLLLTAAVGTFLTTFLVTLNNHTVAAVSLLFAVYPAARIVVDGSRRPYHFALAGFFAAFTCTNELPAALFGLAMFGLLLQRSRESTLKCFVPAALLPVAGFFATTYIVSGSWRPFYAEYGTEMYLYVFEGIPSYWMNPGGLDANREPWYVYLLHCTVGHHGIFSLSPVFLLTLAGWIRIRKSREHPLQAFLWMGLLLTCAIMVFYLLRTENYNYGGRTSGLRWMFWLIPLWLIAMIPTLDSCWLRCRWTSLTMTALFSVSVFSAFYPLQNPWQHPWLFQLMTHQGWIDYDEKIPDFKTPLMTWFRTLPDRENAGTDYWIEFTDLDVDGSLSRLRLSDAGQEQVDGQTVQKISVRQTAGTDRETEHAYFIDRASFADGLPPAQFLRWPGGGASAELQSLANTFLHGLPQLRQSGYRRGKVRYLKTSLRRDAFKCRHAAGQVKYCPLGQDRSLLYRTDLWLCPEVPFGVLQIEMTVFDMPSRKIVAIRRLQAVAVGKKLEQAE
jgi:hypothetical protein